jgi:hypothetical protein
MSRFHDQFEDADILDTMAWMAMPEAHRIMKLAAMFIDNEDDMRWEHRRWPGATLSVVRPFVKSHYVPPRGQGKATFDMVVKAIAYQKKMQRKRSANRPLRPENTMRRQNKQMRLNALASKFYTIKSKCSYSKELVKQGYNCTSIGSVGDVVLAVDRGHGGGSWGTLPRIYMRQRATGRRKVVVVERPDEGYYLSSIESALLVLAPVAMLRDTLGGEPAALDFDREGFAFKGKLVPWRNVRKVYDGDEVHETRAIPKRPK